MSDIPSTTLSEQIQDCIGSRRVIAAVFTSYQFDPAFFEQDVLPVLFESPLSHIAKVRLIQLEDQLRSLAGLVAVYYDAGGLIEADAGSARLDCARIPVRQKTGVFHAKNVFLLVERPPEDGEEPEQSLLVATMSANLTRSGWWHNVEACHVDEIEQGSLTTLRRSLLDYLNGLKKRAAPGEAHRALEMVSAFLKKTEQATHRSLRSVLHSHFFNGVWRCR